VKELIVDSQVRKKARAHPVSCGGMIRAATEPKKAEEALRESEERYRLLAENVSDVIWIRDMNLGFSYISPSVERMTGYTAEEAMNLSLEETYTPESIENARKALAEEMLLERQGNRDQGRVRTLEMEGYCKEGSKVWTEASMRFLRDDSGQLLGILGISRDITRRKQAEDALRKAQDDLERRVHERTAELKKANEELEARRKKLEETNTALKVLMDRRPRDKTELEQTLLLNIKSLVLPYLETLKAGNLDEKQRSLVNVLESNLNEAISPFIRRLSSDYLGLTPTEIRVANLIRQGKSNKEVAQLLGIGTRTIEAHRERIRDKLGIKNKKINLRTQLMSLD
jgi:PAS domain S-box-containing protein